MHSNISELGRIFKTSLYGLAMSAGLILGLAEGSWLPYGTLFLAVIGYWATESPGHFALGNILSNLAGFTAVGLAAIEFFSDNPEGKLLSGTHLVVYAAWIVFLQKSSVRKYWSICALSVLQVAVAAVLTTQSWYGGALVAFAIAAMWTLAVFSLYYAVEQYQERAPALAAAPAGVFCFGSASSDAGHEIQFDSSGRWITWRFIGGVGMLALLALLMSTAFYILTPRVWIGRKFTIGETIEESEVGRRNLTGFTQQVRLGDLGQILESLEPVMSIQVYDVRGGHDRRLSAEGLAEVMGSDEPLFRGGVMVSYSSGNWESEVGRDIADPLQRTPGRADIRQDITLEPVAGDILFCFGTPVACEIVPDRRRRALYSQLTGVLRQERRNDETRGAISYLLYTDIPKRSTDGIPRVEMNSSFVASTLHDPAMRRYLERCLGLPTASLSRLIALARALEDDEEQKRGRKPTTVEMSRRLESYLRDSGEYRYSMSLTIQDPNIDPVEDFLFNRKTGHCEYFASTLALMLRAVDIPSRLMNGFKGGETNYRGQIEVQQRHAHTWVEAWGDDGTWLVLDPTPAAARAESVKEVGDAVSWSQQLSGFVNSFWSDWVMNFSPERQQESLYLPLKDFLQKFWAQAGEAASDGPAVFAWLWKFLTNPREWFTANGLLFVAVLAGVVYGFRKAFRFLRGRWQWFQNREGAAAEGRILVPFYERFLELMTARGLFRPSDQTPAEFAQAVARQLNGTPASADVGHATGVITDLFYRVRYGELELNPSEVSVVDEALLRIEQAGKSLPV